MRVGVYLAVAGEVVGALHYHHHQTGVRVKMGRPEVVGARRAVQVDSAAASPEVEEAVSSSSSISSERQEKDELRFLTASEVREVASTYGTPAYVYDAASLEARASEALAFPNAYGLTVRYAMKACPNGAVLKLFDSLGLHFDASSTYEARRAMAAGVAPEKLSLSTQQLDADVAELMKLGVEVNACSLSQIDTIGTLVGAGTKIGLRVNPGLGSGGTSKTNVGGPSSSFGIWHGLLDEAVAKVEQYGLEVVRVHTHIGSGSDPQVWQRVSKMSLDLCERLGPSVQTLNLGGGYKVARMKTEKGTDLASVGAPVVEEFKAFFDKTGTQLKLEIEPGTYLVANAGSLVAEIQDVVTTKKNTAALPPDDEKDAGGFDFLKLDCGMTSLLRPSLYGAQHPIVVVKKPDAEDLGPLDEADYVVVGHCCESGDLLTPAPDQPEVLATRLTARADRGDLAVIESVGAYCAAMSTKGYNSFPEPPELIKAKDGSFHLIKQRSTLDQLLQNEIPVSDASAFL